MERHEISIVVPVYKVEEYLDQCVSSILNQTFADFELILVDDGSPDNCPQMCDCWKEKDERIRVIHKENGGPQDAVKHGVEAATGQYITFADSDDWVETEYLRILYYGITENCADVAQCSYQKVYNDKTISYRCRPQIFDENEIRSDLLTEIFNQCMPSNIGNQRWAKIYKAEHLRQAMKLCDLSVVMGEDLLLNFAVFGFCKKIVVLDTPPLYNYRSNPASITAMFTKENIFNQDLFFENLKNISEAHGCSVENISVVRNRGYMEKIYLLAASKRSRTERKRDIQRIVSVLDKKTALKTLKMMPTATDRIGLYLHYFGMTDIALLLVDLLQSWRQRSKRKAD